VWVNGDVASATFCDSVYFGTSHRVLKLSHTNALKFSVLLPTKLQNLALSMSCGTTPGSKQQNYIEHAS